MLLRHFKQFVRMYSASASPTDEVLFEVKNHVGIITLNRPKVLNSLNTNMVKAIYSQLKEWERKCSMVIVQGAGDKAFCAGGDVVFATSNKDAGKEFFRHEYKMNYLIGTYRIPYISLLDGVTMGGGVGISVHGKYRVATEKTIFAMPETTIGLFPDVGGSYFLPKLEGRLGLFCALSGYRLQGVDVVKAGVATHIVTSSEIPKLINKLVETDPDYIGELLSSFCRDVSKTRFSLDAYHHVISNCFGVGSVEEVIHELWRDGGEFAKSVAKEIQRQSPISLKITFKELAFGSRLGLKECLQMEYRLACAALDQKASHDFYEGENPSQVYIQRM